MSLSIITRAVAFAAYAAALFALAYAVAPGGPPAVGMAQQ